MKYNDEAFNISARYYPDIQEVEIDDIDKQRQNKLLQILLKRFSKELEENKANNNGIIKIRFKTSFFAGHDEESNLIEELVESQKFDSFASQYCFYLSDSEIFGSYFDIIWDYKTYFEAISMSQNEAKTESDNPVRKHL